MWISAAEGLSLPNHNYRSIFDRVKFKIRTPIRIKRLAGKGNSTMLVPTNTKTISGAVHEQKSFMVSGECDLFVIRS